MRMRRARVDIEGSHPFGYILTQKATPVKWFHLYRRIFFKKVSPFLKKVQKSAAVRKNTAAQLGLFTFQQGTVLQLGENIAHE
jgi:hypothetical protein